MILLNEFSATGVYFTLKPIQRQMKNLRMQLDKPCRNSTLHPLNTLLLPNPVYRTTKRRSNEKCRFNDCAY